MIDNIVERIKRRASDFVHRDERSVVLTPEEAEEYALVQRVLKATEDDLRERRMRRMRRRLKEDEEP